MDVRPKPLTWDREQVGPDGRTFPWGPIDKIHEIGEYQIIEYREDKSGFNRDAWETHNRTVFHPYVNGKDSHESFVTLDEAIVGAIAFKNQGAHSSAAYYASLILRGS